MKQLSNKGLLDELVGAAQRHSPLLNEWKDEILKRMHDPNDDICHCEHPKWESDQGIKYCGRCGGMEP